MSAQRTRSAQSLVFATAPLTVVPRFSQIAISLVGLNPGEGQLLVSLLLAPVVVPGSRYLRPQIERLFVAERHSLERGVERLLRDLPACANTRQILTLLGEQLDFSFRPESCIL